MSRVFEIEDVSSEIAKDESPQSPKSLSESGAFDSSGASAIGECGDEQGEFPTDALPPIMAEMVRECARVTQTPEALAAAVALGCLSTSIGGGLLSESDQHGSTPANLFLLVGAKSGTGKGQVFAKLTRPLAEWDAESLEEWRNQTRPNCMVEIGLLEKRFSTLQKTVEKEDDDNRKEILADLVECRQKIDQLTRKMDSYPRLFTDDATSEAIAHLLASGTHEAMASLSAEARKAIQVLQGRYSNASSDESIYLKAYSGDPIRVDRRGGSSISLDAPRLCVLWLIQPDKMIEMIENPQIAESGFLQRFLIAEVEADFEDEPKSVVPIDTKIAREWDQLIRSSLETYHEAPEQVFTVRFEKTARESLRVFRNHHTRRARKGQELADVATFVSRWAENATRLALCLHVAKLQHSAHLAPISEETARNAIRVVSWFASAQLDFLAVNRCRRAEERRDNLLRILERKGLVSRRDLKKSHGYDWHEVQTLAEQFPEKLLTEKLETGGRPGEVARIT